MRPFHEFQHYVRVRRRILMKKDSARRSLCALCRKVSNFSKTPIIIRSVTVGGPKILRVCLLAAVVGYSSAKRRQLMVGSFVNILSEHF